uniref:dihydrofolate reductase n=1 Tax=Plectus sambesii TaxID=2011161 RepID=A0A914W7Z7_9BILA
MPVRLNLIAAACNTSYAIGYEGRLPWDCLPNEYAYFKRMVLNCPSSKKNVLIFGPKTFAETKHIISDDRIVAIIISRSLPSSYGEENGAIVVRSLNEACEQIEQIEDTVNAVWVCGGVPIYKMALASPNFHRLYLTRIMHEFPGDRFFPQVDWTTMIQVTATDNDARVSTDWQVENGIQYQFCVYKRIDG